MEAEKIRSPKVSVADEEKLKGEENKKRGSLGDKHSLSHSSNAERISSSQANEEKNSPASKEKHHHNKEKKPFSEENGGEPEAEGDDQMKKEREQQIIEQRERLEKASYFFCKIDRNGAEALLLSCKEDSFLVRHSSVQDHYALSLFNFKTQSISHTLIKPLDYGRRYFQLQDSARLFPSVEELISKAPELQGFHPVLNTSQIPIPTHSHSHSSSPSSSANSSPSPIRRKQESDIFERSDESDIERMMQNLSMEKVEEEARKLMEEGQGSQNISLLKRSLKLLIESHDKTIQHYDQLLVQQSIQSKGAVKLSEEDNLEYLKHIEDIEKLRNLLYKLRLKGEDFKIIHKGQNKILKCTSDSTITFCSVKRTTNPQDLVPQDMSQYAYFNVGVIEGRNGSVYEITSATSIHYVDQLQKIVKDPKIGRGGCCVYWKNGKKSSFTTVIPDEAEEVAEVIGTHLKRFNQSTIKQIQLLRDIYKCKSTAFDASSAEHVALLERLWRCLNPEEDLSGIVSKQWKTIGFQGNNPATDFRGMGLLGLLNLIYFAENYTDDARKQIKAQREYPWATTGINITNMIVSMLNLSKELMETPWSDKRWHTPMLNLFYYADNDDTFDELYSQAFLLFDRLWVHSSAKYMDFPSVIQKLQSKMEELLKRKPLDVNQLSAWLSQLNTSFD